MTVHRDDLALSNQQAVTPADGLDRHVFEAIHAVTPRAPGAWSFRALLAPPRGFELLPAGIHQDDNIAGMSAIAILMAREIARDPRAATDIQAEFDRVNFEIGQSMASEGQLEALCAAITAGRKCFESIVRRGTQIAEKMKLKRLPGPQPPQAGDDLESRDSFESHLLRS
jgi:hypothetical protein